MHLHIFLPGENLIPDQIRSSPIASARLRQAPLIELARTERIDITIGDSAPAQTTLAVVGKIGVSNIGSRHAHWINQIKLLEQKGRKVALEYTDHHLEVASPMTPFYREAVKACSTVVTPTAALTGELKKNFTSAKVLTIHDMLEYPKNKPKKSPCAEQIRAMWFGHPSNAEFLARYIDGHSAVMANQLLIVISTPETIKILEKYHYKTQPSIDIRFAHWSQKAVLEASRQADYCVIPSDLQSPKRFASNNRLITALALGLPTVATPIASYREFSDFFAEERTEAATKAIKNPAILFDRVATFQESHLEKFELKNIMRMWHQLLVP